MAKTQTFSGITIAVLERMRATTNTDYSLALEPDGRSGHVSGKSVLGDLVIRFVYEIERAEMQLTIIKKPMFVPFPIVWAEFQLAVRQATYELTMQKDGAEAHEVS